MILEEMMRDERIAGQERVNRLNQLLLEQNRVDDMIKAASDREYQQKLFKEFDL